MRVNSNNSAGGNRSNAAIFCSNNGTIRNEQARPRQPEERRGDRGEDALINGVELGKDWGLEINQKDLDEYKRIMAERSEKSGLL